MILAARALIATGFFWIGVIVGLLLRLTYHMTDVVDLLPYSTVSQSLNTPRRVAVKFAIQPSLHSYPINMRAPDCRWENTWDFQDAWVERGFRLSIALWMACMVLSSRRMTWGPLIIGCLLIHGVFTLR